MKLIRKDFVESGIFGTLESEDGAFFCRTLEHSYFDEKIGHLPKLPPGVYTCVRGVHRLKRGGPFVTFEVTNVPGHSGILFHPGNVEADSEGCILLGLGQEGDKQITDSRLAFEGFLEFNAGLDQFELTVE